MDTFIFLGEPGFSWNNGWSQNIHRMASPLVRVDKNCLHMSPRAIWRLETEKLNVNHKGKKAEPGERICNKER